MKTKLSLIAPALAALGLLGVPLHAQGFTDAPGGEGGDGGNFGSIQSGGGGDGGAAGERGQDGEVGTDGFDAGQGGDPGTSAAFADGEDGGDATIGNQDGQSGGGGGGGGYSPTFLGDINFNTIGGDGGKGGKGGSDAAGGGGGGGGDGARFILTGSGAETSLEINATVTGGNGGHGGEKGGNPNFYSGLYNGDGGDGGNGIQFDLIPQPTTLLVRDAVSAGRGGDARDNAVTEEGGQGGVGLRANDLANLQIVIVPAATITGGDGGEGIGILAGGGKGGTGLSANGFSLDARGEIRGGDGGKGGLAPDQNNSPDQGGPGADGGDAIRGDDFTATVSSLVRGGDGGDGGYGYKVGGDGGNGGDGFQGDGFTLVVDQGDSVIGGDSGKAGLGDPAFSFNTDGSPGRGGRGVIGANLDITTSGAIRGGLTRAGADRPAKAIQFTDGANRLELRSGYSFVGAIDAADDGGGGGPVADDTLALGGAIDATFNVSQIGAGEPPPFLSGEFFFGFERIEKTGPSDWTLTGSTDTAASWTVKQDALLVNGNLSAATGPITVESGGTLGGTGIIGGATTIQSGATLAPGASPGTLTIDDDLTTTGLLDLEIAGPGSFNLLDVTGEIDLGGTVAVQLLGGYSPTVGDSFDLLDFATLTDRGYALDFTDATLAPGLTWDTSAFPTTGTLTVAVPEPASLALLGVGGLTLLMRRRRFG